MTNLAPVYGTTTGSGASATAVVDYSGVVIAVTVNPGGGGYTAPSVTFSGGGATTQATGIAYGGVVAAPLIAGTNYGGYTMPVVEFGLPNDPAGTQATGHATCVEDTNCTPAGGGLVTVNGIVGDTPGSGYSAAPSGTILDGPSGSPVSALTNPPTFTLTIQSVFLTGFGLWLHICSHCDLQRHGRRQWRSSHGGSLNLRHWSCHSYQRG